MALTPSQVETLSAANALGTPWWDDNPLAWQILLPPPGCSYSPYDILQITLTNMIGPVTAEFPTPTYNFFATVTGANDLNFDKKQTPGSNAAQLTVINLAANEVHTRLFLFTPQNMNDFVSLIPNQVMSVTSNSLQQAAAAAGVRLGPTSASGITTAVNNGESISVAPATVPIVVLTHPKIQLAGRSKFVIKTMNYLQEPKGEEPGFVDLVWIPAEIYVLGASIIITADPEAAVQNIPPAVKVSPGAATATSPSSTPPSP